MDKRTFSRHIALPQDHGSWVFLLSPLLIGLFAGGNWSIATVFLVLAAMSAFLIRQPITIAVKVYSGRRSRRDIFAARFWTIVYGFMGLFSLAGLIYQGYAFLLYLALPGLPVFIWHLYLVSQRAERRKMGVELIASGVLALAAPAGLWVGWQRPDPIGWLLFVLVWLQSAASIVHAYMRLEQRTFNEVPPLLTRLKMGRRAILYTSFNLLLVLGLSIGGFLSPLPSIPYTLQWVETVWSVFHPALGIKPTTIGLRQLFVSVCFTLLFILTWNM